MNTIILFIIHYGTGISIILRILSSIILLFFFIPLQIKEALVKNGLKKLRLQLLAVGVLTIVTNLLTGYILIVITQTYTKQHFDNILAQLVNAVASLALSIVLPIISLWPIWMPSNTPMVTTEPFIAVLIFLMPLMVSMGFLY